MSCNSRLCAAAFALCIASSANAATLSDLVAGSSLVQDDVTFSDFYFEDIFDFVTPLPGDRVVTADEIAITTSSTPGSVSLTATIDPAISITGTHPLGNIFEFFLDFTVSVTGSARTITGIALGSGDLFASGTNGFSEVVYDGSTGSGISNLEIYEDDPALSQANDSQPIAGLTTFALEGLVGGEAHASTRTGLSTFTLTFDLAGTYTPPVPPVPLPAGLPLLLGGLVSLAILRRRRERE